MTANSGGLRDRRLVWITSAAGLAVAITVVWVSVVTGSEGETGATTTVPLAAASTEPEPTSPAPTTTIGPTYTTSTLFASPVSTTMPETPFPTDPIPVGSVDETCEAIVSKLADYRQRAVDGGVDELPELSLGLEEFEHEIDFLGQGDGWALAILEQLFKVRRDWVTAFSAAQSGDKQTADERQQTALGYLDIAISVECPST